MGQRATGVAGTVLLVGLAVVLLGAGAAWWVAAAPQRPAAAVTELPAEPDTVSRESGELASGDAFSWTVPQGESHEFQWICEGRGELVLTVRGRQQTETTTHQCRRELSTVQVGSSGEGLRVFLRNALEGPVELHAQVVRR